MLHPGNSGDPAYHVEIPVTDQSTTVTTITESEVNLSPQRQSAVKGYEGLINSAQSQISWAENSLDVLKKIKTFDVSEQISREESRIERLKGKIKE